ncbi:hypothetical protein SLEP1_g4438 [Rubroshorea leprosula]|uniref:Uncharacterized protein n=1 Tax=Rubroshorea leprosula TaxID=152421 RepID=A0AAV5HT16_9ROSI|nr:hypothetical protein SLEP1_g4438 [Rubroshorea leprosula]
MNLLKIQHHPLFLHISRTALPRPSLSPPILHHIEPKIRFKITSTPLCKFQCFKVSSISKFEASVYNNEEEEDEEEEEEGAADASVEFEDLAPNGVVYQSTLRLVECAMFAAVTGLVYFLSNSLAIENYFGCFFALPTVISSMRWGVAAGRKQMVATVMLLFVLAGPVKALNFLVSSLP